MNAGLCDWKIWEKIQMGKYLQWLSDEAERKEFSRGERRKKSHLETFVRKLLEKCLKK